MIQKQRRSDRDFSEEIEAHIRIEADRLAEDGLTPDEAMAAARRAFGNVTLCRERFYESQRWMWFDDLKRNVGYALRQIRFSPGSSATIILSLALGIGVNTALFSLADQALIRALPVDRPENLVLLEWEGRFIGDGRGEGKMVPFPLLKELQDQNDFFEGVFARASETVHLSIDGEPDPVGAAIVSGSYFPTLGVRPALGRLLDESDDLKPDGHPVVVLSYDFWRNRLGGDPDIVGKRALVNSFPMTIAGVAEQGFHGVDWGRAPSLWVPVMMKRQATPNWSEPYQHRARWLHLFGRLKPGVSREQAEAGLEPWFRAYLEADTRRGDWPQVTAEQLRGYLASRLEVLPAAKGRSPTRTQLRQPIMILLAATGLILLLACLNVANISMSRALARRRGTALRAALGASKRRILGEQLIESAVLTAAGCLLGAAIAPVLSRAIISFMPQQSAGVALSPALDLRVLFFALAITALTTLLTGAAPALFAASVQPVSAIKRQSASIAQGMGPKKALVVSQFALALILLIGAGLFARTLGTLRSQGPGFATSNLLMFRLEPISLGYSIPESRTLIRRVLQEVRSLPDVEQAGVGRWTLLRGGGWGNPVTVEADRRFATEEMPMNAVSPGFFQALSVPITRGRGIEERDSHADSRWHLRTAVINEEFVRKYFQGRDPIGARVGIGAAPDTVADIEIVGVVKTFQDRGLREPEAQIYFSSWERPIPIATFYVRLNDWSQAGAQSIRAAVQAVEPNLTVLSLRTIDAQLDRLLSSERMLAALAGAFAALATVLAMVGLYGVLSFSAERRTREIGIRYALGAPRFAAHRLVLREAALMALAGLAFAVPASLALGRWVENQLFGVRPMDPATIASACLLVALFSLAVSVFVARRAASLHPLEALRRE